MSLRDIESSSSDESDQEQRFVLHDMPSSLTPLTSAPGIRSADHPDRDLNDNTGRAPRQRVDSDLGAVSKRFRNAPSYSISTRTTRRPATPPPVLPISRRPSLDDDDVYHRESDVEQVDNYIHTQENEFPNTIKLIGIYKNN